MPVAELCTLSGCPAISPSVARPVSTHHWRSYSAGRPRQRNTHRISTRVRASRGHSRCSIASTIFMFCRSNTHPGLTCSTYEPASSIGWVPGRLESYSYLPRRLYCAPQQAIVGGQYRLVDDECNAERRPCPRKSPLPNMTQKPINGRTSGTSHEHPFHQTSSARNAWGQRREGCGRTGSERS